MAQDQMRQGGNGPSAMTNTGNTTNQGGPAAFSGYQQA